jgi:hypothetical protein
MKFKQALFSTFFFCLLFALSNVSILSAQTVLSNNYVVRFDPKDIEGKWFVVMSNSPMSKKTMWTDITLQFTTKQGLIQEELIVLKNGQPVKMQGTGVFSSPAVFTWSSLPKRYQTRKWNVVAADEHTQWMIVYCPRTVFSSYIDVLCRSRELTKKEQERIAKCFSENYFLQAKTKHMRSYAHS